tara:strand:+ start:314 stop:1060 length:747 start_codon:yes stop_codon:yes gene_type:complete
MIINENKIIFIHIPKNAGTSVRKELVTFSRKCYYRLPKLHFSFLEIIKLLKNNNLSGENLINIKERLIKIKLDDYFKFCVIRNPYTRIWSLYNFIITKNKNKFICKLFSLNNTPTIEKFNDWINYCYSIFNSFKNELKEVIYDHDIWEKIKSKLNNDDKFICENIFKTQCSYIFVGKKMMIDRYFRMENLFDEWIFMEKIYGCKKLKIKNQNSKKLKNYNQNINFDVDIKNKIYEMQKNDFILLNYQK